MRKLYVSNKDESVRLFKYNWMEFFSKVHYSVPLIIFIPVIGWFLYLSTMSAELSWWSIGVMYVLGLVVWTLVEYALHRFIFHFEPKSKLGEQIHFLFHGVHHDYPNDSKRLVMPPAVSIPLAFLFYYSFGLVLPGDWLFPFFSGLVSGYLVYDMLHYAIHHARIQGSWWNALKTHHLKHHFKDPNKGFGVSSPFWDILIGSNFSKANEKNSTRKTSVSTKSGAA